MNIVITGASRGIGLELTSQALAKGYHVLAVARKPEASQELQGLKSKYKDALEVVAADLLLQGAEEKVVDAVSKWPSVDILINNAGFYADGESTDDFLKSFHTNTVAPFLMTKKLLPKLKSSKNPKAIQITSLMGSIADNESGGSYAYRSSKAALNMIAKTFAQDEPWLISAVVHPGWVKTRMGGAGAPTEVEESGRGIWKVIEGLRKGDTGAFRDFQGEQLPW